MSFAVRVSGLYRGPLGRLPRGRSGRPTLASVTTSMRGILRNSPRNVERDRLAALAGDGLLQDVSFEIEPGSIVAFPGPDLRAVETLFRILIGILPPTGGKVEVVGAVGGFIGPGERLESQMTAAENIARERKFLDFPKDVGAEELVSRIVSFAGLEEFEHISVSRYSTGMQLRLAAAITLHSSSRVLAIGDAMGVADAGFQRRFMEQVRKLSREGVTILLAGPVMARPGFATRFISMDGGKVSADVTPRAEVTAAQPAGSHVWTVTARPSGNRLIRLVSVDVRERQSGLMSVAATWQAHRPQKIRLAVELRHGKQLVARSPAPYEIEIDAPSKFRSVTFVPAGILGDRVFELGLLCFSEAPDRKAVLAVRKAVLINPPAGEFQSGRINQSPLYKPPFEWQVDDLPELPA